MLLTNSNLCPIEFSGDSKIAESRLAVYLRTRESAKMNASSSAICLQLEISILNKARSGLRICPDNVAESVGVTATFLKVKDPNEVTRITNVEDIHNLTQSRVYTETLLNNSALPSSSLRAHSDN